MLTIEYRIWGIVQGVGFRPFIARLAHRNKLRGYVYNLGGGVCTVVTGQKAELASFESGITAEKPQPSEIVHIEKRILQEVLNFEDFTISESIEGENDMTFISPDLSLCSNCVKELWNASDQRYRHPFISCMECGPRYSITDRLPYDRANTSMLDFEMCGLCEKQYRSREDRRFHAQTISCHQCGPQLIYVQKDKEKYFREAALRRTIDALNQGEIVAVKGIGGYHLACSALNETAVKKLRNMKGREAKPFAVMFRDIEAVGRYCRASEKDRLLLQGKEKPIVLLEQMEGLIPAEVNKGSRFTGCFLPYTALQELILKETPPLVMTSANISDNPIIKDDSEMLEMLGAGLAGILYNKRAIRTGIDDSVLKLIDGSTQFIRRARGYVPLPVYIDGSGRQYKGDILATGGQTKNTFCILKQSETLSGSLAYMSQHMGDIDNLGAYESYLYNIEHMKSLFRSKPARVCSDLHPGYVSTAYAERLGLELVKVQHHYAHIASVMAEKGIYDEVIGIAYDGTGYGTDGKIWGGEFLLCSPTGFRRAAHLSYVPMLGGDSSIRDGWKSACAYLYASGLEAYIEDKSWRVLKSALENRFNVVESSSIGRVFDAVSSILGISQKSNYEGEAAILLENRAAEYIENSNSRTAAHYKFNIKEADGTYNIDLKDCIREIVEAKDLQRDTAEIAYGFHRTVAEFTVETCRCLRDKHGINKVALSGGVFQNGILFKMVLKEFRHNGFEVFYNTIVPPNDGGIALGQAYAGLYWEV